MADWRDYWDPHGDLGGDPTAAEYQKVPGKAGRLAYRGFSTAAQNEQYEARQKWQARLLRENPEDMSLSVQNPDDPNFKTPAQRAQEFEDFMEEYEKDLGVFNK
jgi:hypothetical protein